MDWFRNIGRNILDWLPSLLVAILILVAAWVVATLVKMLVVKVLKATKLDEKVDRWGISGGKNATTTDFIGQLVFIVVFLLFLPLVFSRLGLTGVAEPISSMTNRLVTFVPNLLAAALILVVGFFVARIIRDLVTPPRAASASTRSRRRAASARPSRPRCRRSSAMSSMS